MNFNHVQNGIFCQQRCITQNGFSCQQIFTGSNGMCCSQINMGNNGSCCQQIFIGPSGSCCQQMTMNTNSNQPISSGRIIRERRSLPSFEVIHVNGSLQIYIIQDNDESATVESDENYVFHIETKVQNRTLYISTNGNAGMNCQPIIYITMKTIQQISLHGASSISAQSLIKTHNLILEVNGSSNLDLQLDAQNIDMSISGSSSIVLSGTAKFMSARISGSSELDGSRLDVNDADISMLGSSYAKINAKNRLGYDVSGASSLKYGSNPMIHRAVCSFTSSVSHKYYI